MLRLFSKNRTWLIVGSILVLAFFLSVLPVIPRTIKNITVSFVRLPGKVLSFAGAGIASKRALLNENSRLKKEIIDLSLRLERYRQLRDENERLRDLLAFKELIEFETVSAEIISRNPNDWIDAFIIDKGSDDGMQKNAAVCSARGLLGKIAEVDPRSSSVTLITHPGFKAGGTIAGSMINGVIVGSGRGKVKMLYIPIDAGVAEGAVVLTSGFSRIFPKGIRIGEITTVEKSKTGLYKFAVIEPSAKPYDQDEVLCIK